MNISNMRDDFLKIRNFVRSVIGEKIKNVYLIQKNRYFSCNT